MKQSRQLPRVHPNAVFELWTFATCPLAFLAYSAFARETRASKGTSRPSGLHDSRERRQNLFDPRLESLLAGIPAQWAYGPGHPWPTIGKKTKETFLRCESELSLPACAWLPWRSAGNHATASEGKSVIGPNTVFFLPGLRPPAPPPAPAKGRLSSLHEATGRRHSKIACYASILECDPIRGTRAFARDTSLASGRVGISVPLADTPSSRSPRAWELAVNAAGLRSPPYSSVQSAFRVGPRSKGAPSGLRPARPAGYVPGEPLALLASGHPATPASSRGPPSSERVRPPSRPGTLAGFALRPACPLLAFACPRSLAILGGRVLTSILLRGLPS